MHLLQESLLSALSWGRLAGNPGQALLANGHQSIGSPSKSRARAGFLPAIAMPAASSRVSWILNPTLAAPQNGGTYPAPVWPTLVIPCVLLSHPMMGLASQDHRRQLQAVVGGGRLRKHVTEPCPHLEPALGLISSPLLLSLPPSWMPSPFLPSLSLRLDPELAASLVPFPAFSGSTLQFWGHLGACAGHT